MPRTGDRRDAAYRTTSASAICRIVRGAPPGAMLSGHDHAILLSQILRRRTPLDSRARPVSSLHRSSPACARVETAAAAPPLPQVTAAAAVARDVTEWDEFTGRLEPVQSVGVRPRVSGLISDVTFEEGSLVRQGQLLFQLDDRPFQAQVDRLRAELAQATAARDRAGVGDCAAPIGWRPRTRCRSRSASAAPAPPPKRRRASTRVAAALRAARARSRVHQGRLADRRPRQPRARHPRQPGVGRSGRSHAAHDGRVGRSDLRLVRRRRADVPALRRSRPRHGKRAGRARRPADPDGAGRRADASRTRARCSSSTTSSIRRPARSTAAPIFRNPDRRLTPGLFVRLRLPGTAVVPRRAGRGPRRRHRPRPALRARRRRRQDDRVADRHARPADRRPARRAQRA